MTSIRRSPRWLVGVSAAAVALISTPIISLLFSAPWGTAADQLRSAAATSALRVSAITSICATMVAALFGLPLAYQLARSTGRVMRAIRAVALLPIVLPPVVGGVALLLAFGRNGAIGRSLQVWFGIRLPFTMAGAVVAQTFVAMPFFVLAMEGAFRVRDITLDDAAATLGAGPTTALRTVTLPLLLPALRSALLLCWARALGEFGATITFAGATRGKTQTLPLEVYRAFETDTDSAVMLSVLLVGVAFVVLVISGRQVLGIRRPAARVVTRPT